MRHTLLIVTLALAPLTAWSFTAPSAAADDSTGPHHCAGAGGNYNCFGAFTEGFCVVWWQDDDPDDDYEDNNATVREITCAVEENNGP